MLYCLSRGINLVSALLIPWWSIKFTGSYDCFSTYTAVSCALPNMCSLKFFPAQEGAQLPPQTPPPAGGGHPFPHPLPSAPVGPRSSRLRRSFTHPPLGSRKSRSRLSACVRVCGAHSDSVMTTNNSAIENIISVYCVLIQSSDVLFATNSFPRYVTI